MMLQISLKMKIMLQCLKVLSLPHNCELHKFIPRRYDHLVLAKMWGILSEKALNKIQCTTLHGVCTVMHPPLSRQFRTNDYKLLYRRLPHNMSSDTLFATTVSRRCNSKKLFSTNFCWSCSFPMKLKSKVYES